MSEEDQQQNQSNATVVHGIELPPHIVSQLKQLGMALEFYTRTEMELAIVHGADGQLIEDPDGVDFIDKLTLTHAERLERERASQAELGKDNQATA